MDIHAEILLLTFFHTTENTAFKKIQNKLFCFSGDEVLEVNGLKVKGKSVHDICDTLCQMTGTLTFVIVPGPGAQSGATASAAVTGATSAPANAAAAAKDPARDEVPETVVSATKEHIKEILHYLV